MRKACPAGRAFWNFPAEELPPDQMLCIRCTSCSLSAGEAPQNEYACFAVAFIYACALQAYAFGVSKYVRNRAYAKFACCHRSLYHSSVWRSNANATHSLSLGIGSLLAGANSAYAFGVSKYVRNRAYAKFACCHLTLYWSSVWRSNANAPHSLSLVKEQLLADANSAYAFGVFKYVRNRAYAKMTFEFSFRFHKLRTTFFFVFAKMVVESRIF